MIPKVVKGTQCHLLSQAWEQFQKGRGSILRAPFQQFITEESSWLDDYALFMAIKDAREKEKRDANGM